MRGLALVALLAMPAKPAELAGPRWLAESVMPTAEPGFDWAGRSVDLAFDAAAGQAAGSAGCNRWSAAYHASPPDRLSFGPAVATRMACAEPPDLMQREQEFLDALGSTDHFTLDGDRLELLGRAGQRLSFRATSP